MTIIRESCGTSLPSMLRDLIVFEPVQVLGMANGRLACIRSSSKDAEYGDGKTVSKLSSCATSQHRQDDQYYCQKDLYLQIQTMSILLQGCFYYGDLTSCDAKHILKPCPIGTFIVRNSSDPNYLYTLSVKTKRGPTSIRIHYQHGRFSLDSDDKSKDQMPKFTNFLDLVDFYMRQGSTENKAGKCVFLDKMGRKDVPIVLTKPRLNSVPTLMHQARVTINRSLNVQTPSQIQERVRHLPLPNPLKSALKDYPYIY